MVYQLLEHQSWADPCPVLLPPTVNHNIMGPDYPNIGIELAHPWHYTANEKDHAQANQSSLLCKASDTTYATSCHATDVGLMTS
jgi:hypothetical protein